MELKSMYFENLWRQFSGNYFSIRKCIDLYGNDVDEKI